MPGDPAMMMIEGTMGDFTPEEWEFQYQRARELLGLDDPEYIQYFKWLGTIVTGQFGYSSL